VLLAAADIDLTPRRSSSLARRPQQQLDVSFLHFLFTFFSLFHPFRMKISEESITSGNGKDPRGQNPWKEVGYRFFESAARRVVAVVSAACRFVQAESATCRLRTFHSAGHRLE
jgi:hypothetical protein